jgi:hypothetical protein
MKNLGKKMDADKGNDGKTPVIGGLSLMMLLLDHGKCCCGSRQVISEKPKIISTVMNFLFASFCF